MDAPFPHFEPKDLHAVHRAMIDAEHQAEERKERMPSSANSYRDHAAELRIVLDKLLELMPERRKFYP